MKHLVVYVITIDIEFLKKKKKKANLNEMLSIHFYIKDVPVPLRRMSHLTQIFENWEVQN